MEFIVWEIVRISLCCPVESRLQFVVDYFSHNYDTVFTEVNCKRHPTDCRFIYLYFHEYLLTTLFDTAIEMLVVGYLKISFIGYYRKRECVMK